MKSQTSRMKEMAQVPTNCRNLEQTSSPVHLDGTMEIRTDNRSIFNVLNKTILLALLIGVGALLQSPQAAAAASQLSPPGYSLCSDENATCNLNGANGGVKVAYGAQGRFVYKNFPNGSIPCTTGEFGVPDPLPGVPKSCSIPTIPPGDTLCATENGNCGFSGTNTVGYGANGHYIFRSFTNGTACNNLTLLFSFSGPFLIQQWPDPAPGVVKSCFIPAQPSGFRQICYENESCNGGSISKVSGNFIIAYGANGNFVFKNISLSPTTAFECYNGTFLQDPAPNIVKSCLVQGSFREILNGYSVCATEYGFCQFNGPVRVYYGANGNFIFKDFAAGTAGTSCTTYAFGVQDPAPNIVKSCFIPSDPLGYVPCSTEKLACSFTGTATVAYGANASFVFMTNLIEGVYCSNTVFLQDPAPNTPKSCFIPRGPAGIFYQADSVWYCSIEGGTCLNPTPYATPPVGWTWYYDAYYGFDQSFASNQFQGGIPGAPTSFACSNSTFHEDPAPGVVKACFVHWYLGPIMQ
jgi:hypothetical protein